MTLAPCPLCGTNTTPGLACVSCGTPTPAPLPDATAAPAPSFGQWDAILARLQRIAAPRYLVKSVLGYGGMAGVFLAEEPRLGRKVAIKVMAPALMIDPKLVERFMQEARTIAQLSHPNIVTIYEVDGREDLHWFTMTYVGGRTLGQVLGESTTLLPIPVVLAWLYQIGDALQYAHQHGIVHRDIKPGNVLLDVRGNALVTDFGIAKAADTDAGLTRTGMLVGTPSYMSPEQCSSGQVTGASDQYSLGAMAFQMLTGQPPFSGSTLSILQAHVNQAPPPLLEQRPDCPPELADAVERMLLKLPEERWPTLSAALNAAGATPPAIDGPGRSQLQLLAAPAAGISVSGWVHTVQEGTRNELQVLVIDDNGRVLPERRVEWTSSSGGTAAVGPDGFFYATAPGNTQINAVSGSASLALGVTVLPDAVRALDVQPASLSLQAGEQARLSSLVLDFDGSRLEDRAVLWKSNHPDVATVSADGVVHGVSAGAAVITASTGGQSANANVRVSGSLAVQPQTQRTLGSTPAPSRATNVRTQPAQNVVKPAPARVASTVPPTRRATMVVLALVVVALGVGAAITRPWQRGAEVLDGSVQQIEPGPPLPIAAPAPPPNPDVSGTATSAATTSAGVSATAQQPGGGTTQPAAQQPAPAAPVEGSIDISGDLPERATISVTDAFGRVRAVSGRTVRLEPGSYSFEFRAPGYDTDRRTFTVRAGAALKWTPSVKATAPVTPQPQPQAQPQAVVNQATQTQTAQTQTQPARDPRAEQTAIETEIRNFVAAFARRDANAVLPLLPREDSDVWRQMLTSRDVRNFTALLTQTETPRIDGDHATAQFTISTAYRNLNENLNAKLNWIGTFDRTSGGWRLVLARQLRN